MKKINWYSLDEDGILGILQSKVRGITTNEAKKRPVFMLKEYNRL